MRKYSRTYVTVTVEKNSNMIFVSKGPKDIKDFFCKKKSLKL